jgi:glycine/D-amino acid oxidase-like deaminating enzyme
LLTLALVRTAVGVAMSSSDGGGIRLKAPQGHRVVVVGGGLAGLTASLEAIEHGAHVTLVEGEARLGGNSAKATRCATSPGRKRGQPGCDWVSRCLNLLRLAAVAVAFGPLFMMC